MNFYEATIEALTEYSTAKEKCWPDKDKESSDDFFSLIYNQRHESKIVDGIGYIDIRGMLLSNATDLDRLTGNTDYDDVIDDIDEMESAGVQGIVFVVNSGGGMVSGAIECAERIRDIQVPTVAFVNGCACSAAYKLISGCTAIVSKKSAQVGSIGAISVYLDKSALVKGSGLNYLTFVNDGAILKSIGHGNTDLTEEQKAFIQSNIDRLGKSFQEFVLSNREEVSREVFNAGWYSGDDAIDLGLVDGIGNFDSAVKLLLELKTQTV